jgi:hypothetical protein
MWTTILEKEMTVQTDRGLVLRVLDIEPLEDLEIYMVKVEILGGNLRTLQEDELSVGEIQVWNHISYDRFVEDRIISVIQKVPETADITMIRDQALTPLRKFCG